MNDGKMVINKKEVLIILIASLLIVFFHSLKIDWYVKNGIIPFAVALVSYVIILKDKKTVNNKAYYLLIPITLVLISDLIIKIDASNKILNFIVLPSLITVFLFLLVNKNYHISFGSLTWFFKLFPAGLFSNLRHLKFQGSEENNKKTVNVILGVLLGSVIGVIIMFLLMSADDYFSAFIESITSLVKLDFGNSFLLIISFIILFSIFVNILKNKDCKTEKPRYKKVDEIMVITILSIVNFIFLLFIFSEFSRLTTNFLNLPIKYTYSSYAREGFFQLLFVTVINFAIIAYPLYKSNIIRESKKVKGLVLLLITFSVVLIFNSYYRMFLYIGNYGFTVLRLQVMLFLTMELIIFLILSKKILGNLKYKDALILFIIMISFYVMNLYLCNDTFIDLLNVK